MATFGKSTFDTSIYAAFRPTCPRSLFDFIFRYHERNKGARWDRAVDLGCGMGQATVELTPFKCVTGGTLKKTPGAQSLPFLEDSSVDLVIAAQACRWFDWNKIWPELARVLRKDGSAAFWVPDGNEVVSSAFSDFESVFFTGDHYPSLPSPRSVIMRKVTWDDLLSYLNTWSPLHTFRQHNPTDAEIPRGDIAVGFWKDLK
ncbi:hypothetical protein BD769DRAFT_1633417 [Suillus cothurnatus]|nr:hypothetical protein BD769DRAFT_1633417 [Suillus cothurnatus]